MCARDFPFIDDHSDIAQNYFTGLKVSLVSIKMHTEKVVGASYSLHLGILDYPLSLHLLNHTDFGSYLTLRLLRQDWLFGWLFFSTMDNRLLLRLGCDELIKHIKLVCLWGWCHFAFLDIGRASAWRHSDLFFFEGDFGGFALGFFLGVLVVLHLNTDMKLLKL